MPQPNVTIVVNGRSHEVARDVLSFEEVISLAFDPLPSGDNIVFTVTYRRGHGNKPAGTLVASESVRVKDGMIFDVTVTDKS